MTLTMHQASRIAEILGAARGGKVCLFDRTGSGHAAQAVARSVGTESGALLRGDEDIRDGYLRLSGTIEWFLPLAEVISLMDEGRFVVHLR